jgi:hypothetical protein
MTYFGLTACSSAVYYHAGSSFISFKIPTLIFIFLKTAAKVDMARFGNELVTLSNTLNYYDSVVYFAASDFLLNPTTRCVFSLLVYFVHILGYVFAKTLFIIIATIN